MRTERGIEEDNKPNVKVSLLYKLFDHVAHLGTAAHKDHQQLDECLGWALFGTGWGHRPQLGDTGSHRCHCFQNYCKPGKN